MCVSLHAGIKDYTYEMVIMEIILKGNYYSIIILLLALMN